MLNAKDVKESYLFPAITITVKKFIFAKPVKQQIKGQIL